MQCGFPWLLVLSFLSLSCSSSNERPQPIPQDARPTSPTPAPTVPKAAEPVVVDPLTVVNDIPVFILRGATGKATVGVVLHGHCSHGQGFLQAFQFAAAAAGPFIALQGDLPCGKGVFRSWSSDVRATDRRIGAALTQYLGTTQLPAEILLFGSSQGANVALALARRFPEKYTRLVLMGVYQSSSASGLQRLRDVHFVVGQDENPWPSRTTAQHLRAAGVRTGFTRILGAGHADFHGQGDRLMSQIFRDWGLVA